MRHMFHVLVGEEVKIESLLTMYKICGKQSALDLCPLGASYGLYLSCSAEVTETLVTPPWSTEPGARYPFDF